MSSEITLSLVIPVYNVDRYLGACLDSIVGQTRLPDEIIVVDDGSTDSCPEILREYGKLLPQMKVIRQRNGGLSAARNTGITQAHGEWIIFLDSDDWLEPQHCEKALNMVVNTNLDFALFNGWFDFEGRKDNELIYPAYRDSVTMTGEDWLHFCLKNRKFFHFVWLHIYRRQFIENSSLRFIPPWIHEDVPWTTHALLKARHVRYFSDALIHYRKPIRPSTPGNKLDAGLRHLIESTCFNIITLDQLIDNTSNPDLKRELSWQLTDGGLSIFHYIPRIMSRKTLRDLKMVLRSKNIYRILWKHAYQLRHRRRIAKNWIKSFL